MDNKIKIDREMADEKTVKDVKIYMQSGLVVEFATKYMRIKQDDKYKRLEYGDVEGETKLFDIDLNRIEAITYKERLSDG